jgi:hypothetical protein
MAISIRIAPYGKHRKLIRDMARIEKRLTGKRTDAGMRAMAEAAKGFIVEGINRGRDGWASLNEMTKFLKGHEKILIDSGTFVRSMTTWKDGKRWYAGIPDGATGDKGQDLEMVGEVHEKGANVPVSDGIRGFFASQGFPLRADTKFVTIPPRPWFAPAEEELEEFADEVLEPMYDDLLRRIG